MAQPESVAITIRASSTEDEVRKAARLGDVGTLYKLIGEDGDVLDRINKRKFVDTPLHIAAAAGHTDFAMEMMNLNPSFARKLNQHGFSPIHLALQNGKTEMAVDLLSVDKDLVRVKGREGYTPFHFVAGEGNVDLLSQFLDQCPHCILDLTNRKQTALHIAAQNNRVEAFSAILKRIQRITEDDEFQIRRILNLQDKDGNTVLHIAASNNQPQMIKLLIECEEVDKNTINHSRLTALEVLQRQTLVDSRESVKFLLRSPWRFNNLTRIGANLAIYIEEMKHGTINALLVVFALVLTMTYQAILSPPVALISKGDADHEGKPILDPFIYLLFYNLNGVAFFMAWFITIALFAVVARSINSFVLSLYTLMGGCYVVAVLFMAPSVFTGVVIFSASITISLLIFNICLFRFPKNK